MLPVCLGFVAVIGSGTRFSFGGSILVLVFFELNFLLVVILIGLGSVWNPKSKSQNKFGFPKTSSH